MEARKEALRRGIHLKSSGIAQSDFEAEPKIYHDGSWWPLHEGERAAWQSTKRYVSVFKGWQAGGTVIGPPWLKREMARRGPGDYAVITPTYPLMDNKALPELLRCFGGMVRQSGNELIITPLGATMLWGEETAESRILLRHGTRVDAIEAFTAKAIWCDEPGQLADEVFEQIESRGGVYRARFLLTSRPYKFNFYVKRFWDPFRDRQGRMRPAPMSTEDVECINFPSTMNQFMVEEYEEQAKKMVGPDGKPNWRFHLKYDGIPTKPAGVVLENFDEDLNTFDDTGWEPPADWQRAQGTDFGEVNTGAVQAALDPEKDRWDVFMEYHAGRVSVDDHAAAWRLYQGSNAEDPWCWGGAPSEKDWREKYTLAGFAIQEPLFSDRLLGFQKINEMFASGRLRIGKSLIRLLNQIADIAYDLSETGEPMPFKPIPKEREYHLVAALRYLVSGICDAYNEPPRVLKAGPKKTADDIAREEIERQILGDRAHNWERPDPEKSWTQKEAKTRKPVVSKF